MLDSEKTIDEHVALAEHYLAIGKEEVYLYKPSSPPWALVSEVKSGSTWRFEVPVSIDFKAKHECGLTFSWSVDVEESGANGTGSLQPNTAALLEIYNAIPASMRAALAEALVLIIGAMQAQAQQYLSRAETAFGKAYALKSMLDGARALGEQL